MNLRHLFWKIFTLNCGCCVPINIWKIGLQSDGEALCVTHLTLEMMIGFQIQTGLIWLFPDSSANFTQLNMFVLKLFYWLFDCFISVRSKMITVIHFTWNEDFVSVKVTNQYCSVAFDSRFSFFKMTSAESLRWCWWFWGTTLFDYSVMWWYSVWKVQSS